MLAGSSAVGARLIVTISTMRIEAQPPTEADHDFIVENRETRRRFVPASSAPTERSN
jgi:hypothetical protein